MTKLKKDPAVLIFLRFLKDRLKIMLAFLLFIVIFYVVYFLYQVWIDPFYYGLVLVLAAGLAFGSFDFRSYYKKHRAHEQLLVHATEDLDGLPEPGSLTEEDCQRLIHVLFDNRKKLISEYDGKKAEMNDYYTLWAHQIKTPISAMHLLLEAEDGGMETVELEQELFKIEQYARMVLQYLRLESISSDLILKEYAIHRLIKQTVKKHAVLFIHRKITVNIEGEDFSAVTDEKWLSFVLEQLLSNALKYTHKGSITVRTQAAPLKKLIVEDTGIGIRTEDIPRIFDRGFTGYNGRMDQKSTGIGLYLCRKVLSHLSCTISVTSQVGKGSKFTITFPQKPNG